MYSTYACFANVQPRGAHEQIPTRLSDPPHLVVFSDTSWYNDASAAHARSNHPQWDQDLIGGGLETTIRDGVNVGTIDGAVRWRDEAETEPRYFLIGSYWMKF